MRRTLRSTHSAIFLELLRRRRHDRRLRQVDVARMLDWDQATVSKVEAGERRLDVLELRAWLRVMDVDFLGFLAELEVRLSGEPDLPGA